MGSPNGPCLGCRPRALAVTVAPCGHARLPGDGWPGPSGSPKAERFWHGAACCAPPVPAMFSSSPGAPLAIGVWVPLPEEMVALLAFVSPARAQRETPDTLRDCLSFRASALPMRFWVSLQNHQLQVGPQGHTGQGQWCPAEARGARSTDGAISAKTRGWAVSVGEQQHTQLLKQARPGSPSSGVSQLGDGGRCPVEGSHLFPVGAAGSSHPNENTGGFTALAPKPPAWSRSGEGGHLLSSRFSVVPESFQLHRKSAAILRSLSLPAIPGGSWLRGGIGTDRLLLHLAERRSFL